MRSSWAPLLRLRFSGLRFLTPVFGRESFVHVSVHGVLRLFFIDGDRWPLWDFTFMSLMFIFSNFRKLNVCDMSCVSDPLLRGCRLMIWPLMDSTAWKSKCDDCLYPFADFTGQEFEWLIRFWRSRVSWYSISHPLASMWELQFYGQWVLYFCNWRGERCKRLISLRCNVNKHKLSAWMETEMSDSSRIMFILSEFFNSSIQPSSQQWAIPADCSHPASEEYQCLIWNWSYWHNCV